MADDGESALPEEKDKLAKVDRGLLEAAAAGSVDELRRIMKESVKKAEYQQRAEDMEKARGLVVSLRPKEPPHPPTLLPSLKPS